MIENSHPLVSIGLPVFNGEKYLRQALDSLMAQEFTDFELIISDNASTDTTEHLCKEYAAQDARIRYIRQTNNIGAVKNFEFVLQEAHSEFFMWAAADDQWATGFAQTLLEGLKKNPTAVGAFCPYQLVNEETGIIVEGIWTCHYENRHTLIRLLKFTWHYRDTCIYGLMRRKYLNDIQLKPWGWINADMLYNTAYPIVYLLLSKDNFLLVGEKPLWFKNVTTSHWHSTPFAANPLLAYLAHIVRKINLLIRNAHYIYCGSKSAWLVILMVPFLLVRLFYDSITPVFAAIRIWLSGRKISQVSPHELWRLGIR
jgi:glycosyltransferase involved in cell wall biosynthesis